MARITSRVLTVAIVLTTSKMVWGCMAAEVVVRSQELERTVSHVLIGTLKAFRAVEETPGRFIAEVVVAEAEKGKGLTAGDTIRVRFSSPLALEQLLIVAPTEGHGGGQTTPVPGERLRLYTQLTEGSEFVADYPNCFFALDPRAPMANSAHGWTSADAPAMGLDPAVVAMLAIAGASVSLAFFASHRVRANARRAAQLPMAPLHETAGGETDASPHDLERRVVDGMSGPVAMIGAPSLGFVHGEALALDGMTREITPPAIPGGMPAEFGRIACFEHATSGGSC